MNTPPRVELDGRDAPALLAQLLARRAGYTPEWLAADRGAGLSPPRQRLAAG